MATVHGVRCFQVGCDGNCSPEVGGSMTEPTTPFIKADVGKNLLGCLPPRALLATGRVLSYGAKKYSRDNWHRNRSLARYFDAMLRHLFAWWSGEDKDSETGESHLAHAACCIMFLLEMVEVGQFDDDRPEFGRAEEEP